MTRLLSRSALLGLFGACAGLACQGGDAGIGGESSPVDTVAPVHEATVRDALRGRESHTVDRSDQEGNVVDRLAPEDSVDAQRATGVRERETLGAGESFATPVWIFRGITPEPKLLVQACIHGNEPAGTDALDALVNELAVSKGTVILIPRLHRLACERGTRFIRRDLNREFPGDARSEILERRLAAANFALVGRFRPEVVLTLHEASRMPSQGGTAHTIITGKHPTPAILKRIVARTNRHLSRREEHFAAKYLPVEGSSSEEYVAAFGIEAYAVETHLKARLPRRVRMHRAVTLGAMDALGVEYSIETDRAPDPRPIGSVASGIGGRSTGSEEASGP